MMAALLIGMLLTMGGMNTGADSGRVLIVHNATVYTADTTHPVAEAFVVKDDRFVFVGDADEALRKYPDADRLDADGRAVIPGLIDAHAHLMGLGMSLLQADLVGAASVEEIVGRLQEAERALPPDAWLIGRGWDQNLWSDEGAFPTRFDLDVAFPDRPVWLVRIDGHAGWANTAALRASGLEALRTATDPDGGSIIRDPDGEPTGILVDHAMPIVARMVPPPTDHQRETALRLALQEAARYGLTGIHEAGTRLEDIALYRRAIEEDWFGVRLYGMVDGLGEAFDAICSGGLIAHPSGRLTVRSVKFYMDGALGSRGAALLDDYHDDPGNRGLLLQEPAGFNEDVTRAMECGMQVNTHAIGDRANRLVLDAYETALRRVPDQPGRHRIEHAQIMTREDIERFAELDVIASMQPTHATSDMYWAGNRVGEERLRTSYAWRTFLDAGVRLAFGSDFPVERVDPLLGFHAAITRQDRNGFPDGGWRPEQRISRDETLRAFTIDAAYAGFMDDELGSITRGKRADFVILSEDIMEIEPERILKVHVLATYLDGRPVYEME